MRLRVIAAAAFISLLASACGPSGTPDAQVRAVIARGEVAAEARDLSAVMELVSPGFQDDLGGDREDLKNYLRGYFIAHQAIRLLVRVDSVEFPYSDMAKVRLTLGTLGRESGDVSAFDLAADVRDVELELQLEDGEWRVTRARWRSASG